MKKIIYDFGANNGDNIEYYLLKSDLLVAVEANPELCDFIRKKYKQEINNKKLIVENCILTSDSSETLQQFYIHKENHLLSQFPKPNEKYINNFYVEKISSKKVANIIEKYGNPYYIKIDVENYDHEILFELLNYKIIPDYISVEANTLDVFCTLVSLGNYKSFKLVNGEDVHIAYQKKLIETLDGLKNFKFAINSAGPFGNDINGPWISKDNFFYLLAKEKLGWKDIHCSKIDHPEINKNYLKYYDRKKAIKKRMIKILKKIIRIFKKVNFFK